MKNFKQIVKNILPYYIVNRYISNKNVKLIGDLGGGGGYKYTDKQIEYEGIVININKIYECIKSYCKTVSQNANEDYYKHHAERYLMSLSMIVKYNLYKNTILEFGSAVDFFSFLLKELLNIKDIMHCDEDLRKPLSLPKESADTIICMEIFEHIIDTDLFDRFEFKGIKQMLCSFWETLRSGGKIFLTTPNSCSTLSLSRLLKGINPMQYIFHMREYSPHELYKIFTSLGFEIELLTTAWVYNIDDSVNMLKLFQDTGYSTTNRGDDIVVILKKPENGRFGYHVNLNDVLQN